MKRLIFAALLASVLFALPAQAQQYNQFQIQFLDWEDRPVNLGTSISITFFVGTNTGGSASLAVYKDAAGQLTCTSPITDDSTNTPLLYTTGLMTFFTGARSFKMVVTDGTYTTSYDNINTSQNVRWPPPGVASAGNSLGQNDDMDFSYAGIILDGDTVGQIELIPDADGGIWKIGDTTKQMDLYWYTGSGTTYVFADEGNSLVNFVGISALFDDDAVLYVGSHSDFSVKSSTTKVLDILPLTTDETSTINFGANLQGVDLKLFSATTGTYTLFDASDDSLKFVHDDIKLDDNSLLYAGSDLDFSIKSSTAKNLDILPVTTDESSIVNFGADTAGVDVKAFGATTGLSFLWDASLDKVVVTDLLNLFTTSGAVANQFKVDATGTVAGSAVVLQTTNGGIQVNAGGAANGDLDIDAASTIAVDAPDDITVTLAATGATQDLSLVLTGAFDSSILLTSSGTGLDAIGLAASAGSVKISGDKLDLDTTNDMELTVTSSTGGEDLLITQSGANDSSIILTAAGTGADAISLQATAGIIKITSDELDIDDTNDISITVTSSEAAEDLTLTQTGANDSSILLTAAGTGADAIGLSATAGTVKIAGNFLDVDTTEDLELKVTSSTDAEDILITQVGANDSSITLTAAGTGTDAIGLQASAGGIDIDGGAGGDVAITSTGKSVAVTATEAAADAIALSASNAAGGITIGYGTGNLAITGTGVSADFSVDADLLSIDGTGVSNITVTSNAGAEDFTIALAGATDSHLVLSSTGTSADALKLLTTAGGITTTSAGTYTATAVGAVGLFSNAVEQTITLGNETGASSLIFKAGTGNISMDGVAATTITIGDAAQQGTMKFGESSAAMELDVGTGTGVHTVHIADGAGAQIVTVGSTNTTAGTTIQSGTSDMSITSTDDFTATASGAVALFSNAVEQTITLGNETGASSLALKAGTGNITIDGVAATTITVGDAAQVGIMKFGESSAAVQVDLATGTGAHTVNLANGGGGTQIVDIGSTSSASSLSLFAGTGNIDMQGVAATTITIGKSDQIGTISMGTSTAGLTMNLGTGNGAKVVNVATGTGIDQIVLGGGGTAADNIDIADEDTQANTIDIGGTASTTTLTGTVTNTAGYIKSAVNAGAVVGATCTAVEYSNNGFHRTVLTLLTGTTVTVSDGGDGTGINIYNFPQGNIIVLGAFADVVLTADAHMTGAYAASIGTVTAAADNALSSTEADFVASTAITQGSNQDFHGLSALTAAGLIMVPYNGTTTGAPVYFNAAAADGSADAATVVTAQSGTVVIEWVYLGDF